MGLKQTIRQWFSKAQSISLVNDTQPLPAPVHAHLVRQLRSLPHPPLYLSTLDSALETSLSHWHQDPTCNSLVVLSNPTERIDRILTQIVQDHQTLRTTRKDPATVLHIIKPDPQLPRQDPQLLSQLDALDLPSASTQHYLVVPSLEAFWIRSIPGLDMMQQFLDRLATYPNCFWILGCNQWTWHYLDRVCQIAAYIDTVTSLPALDGSHLQDWILDYWSQVSINWRVDDSKSEQERRRQYFNGLSDLAFGLGQVAAPLWIQSLRYPRQDPDPVETDDPALSGVTLHFKPAVVPDLPSLTPADRFLLYSLLLHTLLTGDDLATSLGDPPSQVRAQCRYLLKAGVLDLDKNHFRIQSAYYPQVKAALRNSSFMVPEV